MICYKQNEKKEFILITRDKQLNIGKTVCFAYSYFQDLNGNNYAVMLKHGEKQIIKKWLINASNQYRSHGLKKEASELFMLDTLTDLDEINKCVQNSGYIAKHHISNN